MNTYNNMNIKKFILKKIFIHLFMHSISRTLFGMKIVYTMYFIN